ncbi:hypothetical protein DL93DRAFT_2169357 [Clavulina sp. PMI_390]|nr:hypothetical protein DL93DRAFT_2169357 [Clavulina sp. PMI_390]
MSSNEQQFTIQPHPAKSNNPADLAPQQPGGGLNNKAEIDGLINAKGGGYIPTTEQLKAMGEPLSREELRKRQENLNK